MEILNCGDYYWAGRIRVEESLSITREEFKNLYSQQSLPPALAALQAGFPGIARENWRSLLENKRGGLDRLAGTRLGANVLELLRKEDWEGLFRVFESRPPLAGIFRRLVSGRGVKDYFAERELLAAVREAYPENWGRIEGDEMFVLFYLYKTAELRLLWILLLSLEKNLPTEEVREELL